MEVKPLSPATFWALKSVSLLPVQKQGEVSLQANPWNPWCVYKGPAPNPFGVLYTFLQIFLALGIQNWIACVQGQFEILSQIYKYRYVCLYHRYIYIYRYAIHCSKRHCITLITYCTTLHCITFHHMAWHDMLHTHMFKMWTTIWSTWPLVLIPL